MDISKRAVAVKLGKSIMGYRKAIGMSQEGLIEHLGVNKNYIGCVERGEALPSITKLCKIANILEVKVSEMVSVLD